MEGRRCPAEGSGGADEFHAEGDRSEEAKKRILSSGSMDSAG